MPSFCSIWDLQKELKNMASGDKLRPQNPEKDSRWLFQRLDQLPHELESQVRARAYKLTRPQYRALWQKMANDHLEVILILRSAADDQWKFNCLFTLALKKMTDFLEDFATKASPFSESPSDPQFKILMENFGTVLDTISIFYDCYDCENRAEVLVSERNAGRMHFFRFEKNDPGQPVDLPTGQRLYAERYPGDVPTDKGKAHGFYQRAEPLATPAAAPVAAAPPEPARTDTNIMDVDYAEPLLDFQNPVFTPSVEGYYMDPFGWYIPDRYEMFGNGWPSNMV